MKIHYFAIYFLQALPLTHSLRPNRRRRLTRTSRIETLTNLLAVYWQVGPHFGHDTNPTLSVKKEKNFEIKFKNTEKTSEGLSPKLSTKQVSESGR